MRNNFLEFSFMILDSMCHGDLLRHPTGGSKGSRRVRISVRRAELYSICTWIWSMNPERTGRFSMSCGTGWRTLANWSDWPRQIHR